jgi:hypothetical protein
MTRALAIALVLAAAAPAAAEPLRLRGDALATVQAPTGLLVLEAGDQARTWLDAQALVWTGAGADGGADGDALVVLVELRDPGKRGSLRLGRHVVTAGGLRPLHVDGASGRARLPHRFELEGFAGLPVVPRFGPRAYDWAVGGRVARPLGAARLGVAMLERRDHGALHTREVAGDATWQVAGLDLAASGAWDLIASGLAEARLSAVRRRRAIRVEGFAIHRSPSHLLPATSLFSVLGDVPSRLGGADVRWRAAPRLDVGGSAALRFLDGEVGEDLAARATLRLDDRGAGSMGLEVRRQGAIDGGWTGIRGFARVPIRPRWHAATELELAIPDENAGRGAAWPWGLAALTWSPRAWELAGAVEAGSSPEHRWRVDALVRLTRRWEVP